MGMSLTAELFYGIPVGNDDLPWRGHEDEEDWLASLYGWTEDDEEYVWNFLHRLPVGLFVGGNLDLDSCVYAVGIKDSSVEAYYEVKRVNSLYESSLWKGIMLDFCSRAGLDGSQIGWHIMPCYG